MTLEERAEQMYREDTANTRMPGWYDLPESIKARYLELAAYEKQNS